MYDWSTGPWPSPPGAICNDNLVQNRLTISNALILLICTTGAPGRGSRHCAQAADNLVCENGSWYILNVKFNEIVAKAAGNSLKHKYDSISHVCRVLYKSFYREIIFLFFDFPNTGPMTVTLGFVIKI